MGPGQSPRLESHLLSALSGSMCGSRSGVHLASGGGAGEEEGFVRTIIGHQVSWEGKQEKESARLAAESCH